MKSWLKSWKTGLSGDGGLIFAEISNFEQVFTIFDLDYFWFETLILDADCCQMWIYTSSYLIQSGFLWMCLDSCWIVWFCELYDMKSADFGLQASNGAAYWPIFGNPLFSIT